jgi:hypothetical protein
MLQFSPLNLKFMRLGATPPCPVCHCCLAQPAGFLLFWQSLIIILLEGCPADLAQYLYLARTVCVDLDASGRKVCPTVAQWTLTASALSHVTRVNP